jgi:hypothetical protein
MTEDGRRNQGMSTSAGIVHYRLKDGTEATAEVEPNTTWTVPEDCAAVTGWEWPDAGGGGFGGGGGPYGPEQGPDVKPGRTWSGTVGGSAREPCEDHDGGMRACCSTRQLGPHAGGCPKSPAFQEAMLDHERMYRHETEVRGD